MDNDATGTVHASLLQRAPANGHVIEDSQPSDVYAELERAVYAALETYSNVHRGSGHNSMVSTRLYEEARGIVLDHLGLDEHSYQVIFCSPRRAEVYKATLPPERYRTLSSDEIGVPLGVVALVVERRSLPRDVQFQDGGGTARLVSRRSVVWAKAPDRFESGTPAIVNVIAFAKSLKLVQQFGNDAFRQVGPVEHSVIDILYADALDGLYGRELLGRLRATLIGRELCVPTMAGERPFVNLDNGASTPTFTPIWDAVRMTWRQPQAVQQTIVSEVKSICARYLNAPPQSYNVVFASNTTEAINLVAESLGNETDEDTVPVILNTMLEHNSNELPWRQIPDSSLIRLGVDGDGFFDVRQLESLLAGYNRNGEHGKQRIKLVAVSGASNVLGVFNDLAEISRLVHEYGARLLVDAAQLVAHRAVDMDAWGIDYLAFSAHKAYAPFGTGVLVARKGYLQFSPPELELIESSGEQNPGGIAGLGKALLLLQRIGLDVVQAEEQELTAHAVRGMARIPGLKLYGMQEPESDIFASRGGVLAFDVKGKRPRQVASALAERGGIGVRSGCHCAHLLVKSLVGVPPSLEWLQGLVLHLAPSLSLPGVVRVSLGIENTGEDVDTLLQVLSEIAGQQSNGSNGKGNTAGSGSTEDSSSIVCKQMEEFSEARSRKVYA